jgi:hypothetical protein
MRRVAAARLRHYDSPGEIISPEFGRRRGHAQARVLQNSVHCAGA